MEEEDDDDLFLNVVGLVEETVHAASADVIWVTPTIAGKPIQMELDTGAAVSLLPHNLYVENFSHMPLEDTPVVLKTYGGERLMPEGKLNVNVDYLGQVVHTSLYVVKVDGPALFGRDWLRLIKLNWHEIKAVCSAHPRPPAKLNSLLADFKEVHSGDMGKLNGVKAKFHVKEGTTPKYRPARQVPYAIRPNVERELQRLQDLNIITPVESSEWATPVVPVMKGNGEVRLCGDFKTTLNPHLIVDQYPLPKVEDVFATLGPGETFTKLDLKQAYLQMEVDDESKQYLTITTSKGLFQYNRLIYGVASAPTIFQRTIEQVLSGCNGVKVMLDDIIITGKTEEEHIENLRCVLTKLKERGLKLNPAKCEYMQKEVAFLGHIIDATGIHMIEDKVQAVNDAPAPTDINELRAFLGLINYYHRFIPNLAAILRPLYGLLQKTQKWYWSEAHERAFCRAKEEIVSMRVLTHYDPDLPITLATDASPYGLGAVLSHVMRDGEERPIAYASKSLTPAEKNYAQIDKEALAIVWAVKKFYMYIFGREFTLITDHKPLTSIFHPAKNIPAIAAARLTRYAMFLAGLQYKIQYRNTKEHCNADGLSRLPQKLTEGSRVGPDGANIMNVSQFQQLPVTATQVQRETERDKIMSQAYNFTVNGWSDKPEEEDLIPFYNRRYELSTYGGCLMWGLRVIIPPKLQKQVLEELHEGHLEVVKMKNLARSYIWWPGFNKDIEQLAKRCPGCQSTQHLPKKAPLHPWEWPSKPWERIHIDYAGPVDGMMFLVVVDAHSKWPEVIPTKTSTSAKTIMILRNMFARFGLPSQLVSDNATTFTSEEFQNFLKINGVKHITSAPYHPSTNGLAERFVQSFKAALKSAKCDEGTVQHKLASFLMAYRNTAHSTTGVSPAEIFLGRPLRTRLDILKPDIARKVADKQAEQVKTRGATKMREFTVGQKVAVRDYRAKPHKWVTGTINAKTGPLSYKVNVGGQIWRRHVDQLKDTATPEPEAREIPETNQANYPAPALQQRENNRPAQPENNRPAQPENNRPAQPENNRPAQPENNRPVQQQNRPDPPGNQPQRHTRSGRLVKPNPKYSSDIYQRT